MAATVYVDLDVTSGFCPCPWGTVRAVKETAAGGLGVGPPLSQMEQDTVLTPGSVPREQFEGPTRL